MGQSRPADEKRLLGLKPNSNLIAYAALKGPLFHGGKYIP